MKIRQFALVVILLALAGCSAKRQVVQEPTKDPMVQEQTKTPFTEASQADTVVTPTQTQTGEAASFPYTGSKGPVQNVWGWRVQIFASATLENARKVAEEARWKFGDQQVFLTESEPYFKVQVGNNLTRQDADILKSRAKALGYKGTFVIEVNLAE